MAVIPVLKIGNKILETKARPVAQVTEEDRVLVRDMVETMFVENGVGLAANQVGVLKRIFVACPDPEKAQVMAFFNPEIIRKEGVIKEFEGCLSIPDFSEPVKRAKTVWMRAMALDGRMIEVKGTGLLSRIFQHEIDHLDGILFVDRLGPVKRRISRKKLLKKNL